MMDLSILQVLTSLEKISLENLYFCQALRPDSEVNFKYAFNFFRDAYICLE